MRFRCDSCGAQYAISDEKLGKKGVKVRCKKCSNIITVRPQAAGEESAPEEQAPEPSQDEKRDTISVDSPSQQERENQLGKQDETSQPSGTGEPESSSPFGDGLDLGEDDDLHDALDGLLDDDDGPGDNLGDEDEQDEDLDRQATRVFNVEEMQQVQAEREQAGNSEDEVREKSSFHEDSAVGDFAAEERQPVAADDAGRDTVEWYAAVDDEQVGPISLNEFARRWKDGEFDSDTLVWKSGFEDWLSVFDVAEFAFLAEDESSFDEESDREDDDERDWASSFGDQDDESGSFDDQGQDESYDNGTEEQGDEYDDEQGAYSGYDEDESSSSASAAAFAADVDWKPAALSSLNDLAEQELASLKPEDPEPEELPFDPDGDLPSGDGLDFDAEMEDGDSSLVAQIAAEEEAIRKAQEEQDEDLEKRDDTDQPSGEDLQDVDAQEKARKEKHAEQVMVASVPEERFIPPRGSLPKWAIGLMVAGGLMMLTLVGVVGYLLARETNPEPSTQPVMVSNPVPSTADSNIDRSKTATPSVPGPTKQAPTGSNAASGTKPALHDGANGRKETMTGSVEKAIVASGDSAKSPLSQSNDVKNNTPKVQSNKNKVTKTKAQSRNNRSLARKRTKNKGKTRIAMVPREQKPKEQPRPKRKKSKGGLLDFEDPDDRAFAAEAGIKAPKAAPKVEKKIQLPPLSNADVLTVMKRHLAEFKACNRKQKEVDSTVRGKMVISFTIGNNGRVMKVGVSSKTARFKGTYVGGCIKSIIKRLKFPEFGGPKKTIPFPFSVN